jgi:phospholipid/cholesterol/gamma-HCH transport system substrate-binding protein
VRYLPQGIKVGILSLICVIGAYGIWKSVGKRSAGDDAYPMYAKFKDASGLPVGSQVVVAGLPVGEITSLSIEGRFARVDFVVRGDIEIWSNAVAYKKSTSLLGSFYIELDPGGPQGEGDSATRLLGPGDQIPLVVEATTPEELFRRIEQTMPRVDDALISVKGLSDDVRGLVRGPIANIANRIDDLVQSEADRVSQILARTDRSLARIELITKDIRNVTKDADDKVNGILDNLDEAAKEAKTLVTSARNEVEQTGKKVRDKLDMVDEFMDHSTSVARKIDEDEGTLGRLVNDSTLADNLTDISEDAKGFLGTLFGMQTYVGLRSEYAFRQGGIRSYITVDIQTRPDKFYYLEFVKGPRGTFPDTSVTCGSNLNPCIKTFVIEDKVRFSFQFGKRLGWAQFRYGIKESSGGVGFDGFWLRDRLKLSVDVFDATFNRLPRLKVAAAWEVFRHLYVLGGIDDVLNEGGSLPIADDGLDIPTQFDEDDGVEYGRDWFLGASLRFNDKDLAALLFIGGAALTSVLD